MTARSLERRGAFTLACMAVLIIVALVAWLASALAEASSSRSFYDRNGHLTGWSSHTSPGGDGERGRTLP